MEAWSIYPLEQLVTCSGFRQQGTFAQKAFDLLPAFPDMACEITRKGLLLLGETEADFVKPREFLSETFGSGVRFTAPQIRLAYDSGWQEPVMGFRIVIDSRHLEAIRQTLLTRGASIGDIETRAATSVIRGEASLLDLIGISKTLHRLSNESAQAVLWFSHYQPIWSYATETMACYRE